MTEKTDLFLLLKKRMKKIFLRKEFHSQYEFMQSWIKTNTNIVVHDLFLLFNNLHGTLIWEKFRSASHKDANLFLFEKNSNLHLRKMQICFCIEKNSDLHLEKMQICFYVEKNPDIHLEKMQISFYVEKNPNLHLKNMQICFMFEKNPDLHLR